MTKSTTLQIPTFSRARLSYDDRQALAEILAGPLQSFMPDAQFTQRSAYERIFVKCVDLPTSNTDWYLPGFDRIGDDQKSSPRAIPLLTAKQEQAIFTQQEIIGLNTFIDGGCARCHMGPMLSDNLLHLRIFF